MHMSGHPLSYLHLNRDFFSRSSSQLAVRTTDQTKYTGNFQHIYTFKSISLAVYHKRLESHWKETKYTLFNLTDVKLPKNYPHQDNCKIFFTLFKQKMNYKIRQKSRFGSINQFLMGKELNTPPTPSENCYTGSF